MRKIKGILIDVYNQEVREVKMTADLDSYYKHIKCDLITCVSLDEDHDIVVDDEGLLKCPKHFFSIDNDGEPQYAGNGIIFGVNEYNGEWINHKLNLEEFKQRVTIWEVKLNMMTGLRCWKRIKFAKENENECQNQ